MFKALYSSSTHQTLHDPHEKPGRYIPASRNGKRSIFARMSEAWMSQSQRMRWLKTGAIVFAIICLFYWFSPAGVQVYNEGTFSLFSIVSICLYLFFSLSSVRLTLVQLMLTHKPVTHSGDGQVPADSSYGTDKCTHSYSKDKPIVQYVLMIDAGSSGSRIHVYKFNNCGPTPELEGEDFKMTEVMKGGSGLSRYKDDPVAAAKSLDPLLAVAMEKVPDKLKGCSPVAVKATAGLRMIGPEASEAILKEVRRHLEEDYPFPVLGDEKGGVAVMDGADEGVYAWITTNYLLGKIGGPDPSDTAAIFDLGGGSTQIVFEPNFKDAAHGGMPEKLADGDHKYELDFGGRKFELYQHSHLGYGLMAAREALNEQLVTDLSAQKEGDESWMAKPIVHPCIAPGMSQEVDVPFAGKKQKFNFTGPSKPAPAQCRNLAEKILKKDAACALAPCSFNGVHQPSLAKTFHKEDVYIFSFFYDRTKPLGMPDSFTLREMHDLTDTVCQGEEGWDVFSSNPEALKELRERPEHCLDLNFMMALLHTGYDMPIDREVKIAKKMKGNELGWCLGAR
jgi:guanosine-diphosphatase